MDNERLTKFIYEDIYPQYLEYKIIKANKVFGEGKDKLAAKNLATAVYHFRETLPDPFNEITTIGDACPDYYVLGDIVNSFKHKMLDPKRYGKKRQPVVWSSEDIKEVLVSTDYIDAKGFYHHQEKEVVVIYADGSNVERDIMDIITNVMNFLFTSLFRWKLIDSPLPSVTYERTKFTLRVNANTIQFKVNQIYDIHLITRWQYFNYVEGCVEPNSHKNNLLKTFTFGAIGNEKPDELIEPRHTTTFNIDPDTVNHINLEEAIPGNLFTDPYLIEKMLLGRKNR